MDFPISRLRLQNYRTNEAAFVQMNQSLQKEFKTICSKVETTVLTTDKQKYVYSIPSIVKVGGDCPCANSPVTLVHTPPFLKELIVAIKHAFPDSAVMVDPLETYILIDWS
jgi:hypothetical protein